ncbi:helix-turn-helix domain-containing protein [Halieaceae bacterium IMCC14734]|uniref:Helix-turn-helix domain-containing protein n=1 Tax=Candidatus Litorirhabdus singularis TaxID=2518993 RepID=A0ABT3TH74_9GAMM|nr:helix-turn-helix domain-containing protein [Candidatus Litorirhabdus singularis]
MRLAEARAGQATQLLCDALGAGERTLELSFRKHLGVSPKQYLKAMRMLGCRPAEV